jgi:hypothetical protein
MRGSFSVGFVIKLLFGWAGYVARMGRGEACTGFWWENLRERANWRDPGVDGRIIYDGFLGSGMWGYELDWVGSG